MDEVSRYSVGLDLGTSGVRAVVGSVGKDGKISIVGYGEVHNSGMRKGLVANLSGPAQAMDTVLADVEKMSGYEVNSATISVNGTHILSTKTDGMIAVGPMDHEINEEDLYRIEDVAVTGKIPANREILELVPHSYALDGQGGIKDPLGMTGSRLEVKANVVSALMPYCQNVRRAAEMAKVATNRLIPSVVAAARAVLTEKQVENGVGVVELGAATTSVAVYEDGDLQYVGVVAIGSNNITNDLAMQLKTDPDVAEEIKRRFVSGSFDGGEKDIVIKRQREELSFARAEVDEVAAARLEEIFEAVRKELKRAGYDRRLPEGVTLVGGGARMRDIDVFAKKVLELAVRVGEPKSLGGVSESIEKPEYAAAVGLMLIDSEERVVVSKKTRKKGGSIKKLFSKF
jgi:cell division protein FtsA